MKKTMYICAVAAVALASCANDEVVDKAKPHAISFRNVVDLNSRSTEMNTAGLQNAGKLYVTTFNGNGELLYDETAFTWNGSEWTTNPPLYWVDNTSHTFLLTYPKLSEWSSKSGVKVTKGDSLFVEARTYVSVQNQVDYLVGYVKSATEPTDGSALSVTMKHAFCQVEVRAKNNNPNYIYEVKGVRFGHVLEKVNFNLATMECTKPASPRYTWIDVNYNTPFELNGTPQSLMGGQGNAILPPQKGLNTIWDGTDSASGAGSYLAVKIRLTTKDGDVVYPRPNDTDGTHVWAAVPVDFNWESGKKYVYTLDFTTGAGQVSPDRLSGGTGSYWGPAGTYILGEPLRFTVTTSPWTDASDSKDLEVN